MADPMEQVIIFDLDGTLLDTPRAIVETFSAVLAEQGLKPCDPDTIRATVGTPLADAFAQLLMLPLDDTQVAMAVENYQRHFRLHVLPHAKTLLFPGVADGLITLSRAGFQLAVATSKFQANAEATLAAAGLLEHFAVIVGADAVPRPKPDPASGLLILNRLGIPASHAVMVGDTTHDLHMAHAAGMRSVAVSYGVHDPARLRSAEPTWLHDNFPAVVETLMTIRDTTCATFEER